MALNRPRGRQRNVTGRGKSVNRRGSGLGTGPVGNTGGYSGRPGRGGSVGGSNGGGRPVRSGGRGNRSGGGLIKIIVILAVLLFGGGTGLGSLLGGMGGYESTGGYGANGGYGSTDGGYTSSGGSYGSYGDFSSIWGGLGGGSFSSGWDNGSNTGELNTSVVSGARDKYTDIIGKGKDEMTIMVYLCGTDLESRSAMATSDLQEMIDADVSEKVNLIIYTGGCKGWKNNVMSSRTNQIYQIKDEGLICLDDNVGNLPMTEPDTLSDFIRWCSKKYPANRNALIFWDHGGGSVSGFGYDEKNPYSGSMSLAGIDQALTEANMKFDFVGFDACLMATAENALMLTEHADYMIASEETEPGIGWYYTNWLTKLSENTSMSTLEVGKNIIDDFVDMCAKKCPGQSTTLSIVDLAEIEKTLPKTFADFSESTYELIKEKEYERVSNARSDAKEFAVSSKIDQVDFVHLAKNMNTSEGDALAETILDAVKYNRTSSNMANAYGLSIYFPYRKTSMVDQAVDTYEAIGMDDEYSRCIQAFATMEVSGQTMSGGTASPVPSLMDMFGTILGGNANSLAGLSYDDMDFLNARALSEDSITEYFDENAFDGSLLQWEDTSDGAAIRLPETQWELVHELHANLFIDDGEGFIDLGLDNVYDFDEEGNLLAPTECTWLAINEQPVAYYHEYTVDDGENYSITGRIPVLYNGERAELIAEFTDENPYGEIVGVRRVYADGETTTVAKNMDRVQDGDAIDFICDYYSYAGEYMDGYKIGEQMIVHGELEINDVYMDETAANLTYRFTDIYNQAYWTSPVVFE